MAEFLDKLPEWAYQPSTTDTQEIIENAANPDVYSCSELEITGTFFNGEPCNFKLDVGKKTCTIHGTEITQIRSSFLKKLTDNDNTRYSVQISTKIGTEFVWFEIFYKTPSDALKVLNMCRKGLSEKGGHIDFLCPQWSGELEIEVSGVEDTSDIEHKSEVYTVILDAEALFLFHDFNKRVPDFFMCLYKESIDNSIERAIVQHNADVVILESITRKFVIHDASKYQSFTKAIRKVKSKPKVIFEDHSKIVEYLNTDLNLGTTTLQKSLQYEQQEVDQSYNQIRADHETDYSSAGAQILIIARELDQAVDTLAEHEDLSLPWIVAEDEIRQMIENPEVLADSHTDMLSGGLDPNNPDHVTRSFNDIKEQLANQNYCMALSRVKGMKAIFQESRISEIKNLISIDDLELLKKLYFHSLCSD